MACTPARSTSAWSRSSALIGLVVIVVATVCAAHRCRPPRPAQRRGAVRLAGQVVRAHPPVEHRRPRRGAERRAGRPCHQRRRDVVAVLLVGRVGVVARWHTDGDGRRRDAGLRLGAGAGRVRHGGAAGDRVAQRAAPPRRRLRHGQAAQCRGADRRSARWSPAPRRCAPTAPARYYAERDQAVQPRTIERVHPRQHHRCVPVPLRRGVQRAHGGGRRQRRRDPRSRTRA